MFSYVINELKQSSADIATIILSLKMGMKEEEKQI